MKKEKILVIGAAGQLGYELTALLRSLYGIENVVPSDIQAPWGLLKEGLFEPLNILDQACLHQVIQSHQITQIYHLAAVLSASAEKKPHQSWRLNMEGLLHVLDAARTFNLDKVFWPSSIAVFGPDTPKENTPQQTIINPDSIYGISKLAGERWCEYYFRKYAVDIRSLRYPGLIGHQTQPGGGVTDYAVAIYFKSVQEKHYECFIQPDSSLPMMYIKDALRATLQLMEASREKIRIRSSYNLASMSLTPKKIAESIKKHIPDFTISYRPDYRQKIANSWPSSIDDSSARTDWGWSPHYDLETMTSEMIENIMQHA